MCVLYADTDKASHFVVQWLDTDVGKFSVVPRNKVASDPPFQLGLVVLVKCSCKKGGFTTERAKIASQGGHPYSAYLVC